MKALILYTNTGRRACFCWKISLSWTYKSWYWNYWARYIKLCWEKHFQKKGNKFRLLFHFSQEFIDKGINKNKLYSFSLPVHSKFSKYVDKIKAKKELNLNPNMNHIKLINIKF